MNEPKYKLGDKVRFIEHGKGQLTGCVIGGSSELSLSKVRL